MKKFVKNLVSAILALVISLILTALIGVVAWRVYNVIAWNFNLAPLDYWTCSGVVFVLATTFKIFGKINKED